MQSLADGLGVPAPRSTPTVRGTTIGSGGPVNAVYFSAVWSYSHDVCLWRFALRAHKHALAESGNPKQPWLQR